MPSGALIQQQQKVEDSKKQYKRHISEVDAEAEPQSSSSVASLPPTDAASTDVAAATDVSVAAIIKKHPKTKRRKYKQKAVESTSPAGVLILEIQELLKEKNLTEDQITNPVNALLNEEIPMEIYHRVVDNVEILKFTSNGDGLAIIDNPEDPIQKKQIAIVPFGIPGDVVSIKVFKSHPLYVESDLIKITQSSKFRNDDLIRCKYFGICSGCQFQTIDYEQQLFFKKQTIENAYKNFAPELNQSFLLPEIDETISSPLQYGYRTKLTPHFDMPKHKPEFFQRPNLGFGAKGRPQWRVMDGIKTGGIIDIEECVIGTTIINKGMANERGKFMKEFNKYKKGATILLRENTKLKKESIEDKEEEEEGSRDPETAQVSKIEEIDEEHGDVKIKTCVTNTRQIVREIVCGFKFEFSAGEFFQNNNSILPKIVSYVQQNLKLDNTEENYLIDAYCGSGLFSITSSKAVKKVIGVEISADSVKFAEHNAKLNGVENCEFIVGKAEKIFADIKLPNDKTSIILDPPRKGCDEVFLKQLAAFNPTKIIYISCNVHSQARDLEFFIKKTDTGKNYKIESIRGFDFFPQTHHVESVAVLSLI
ncbi:hypothetical protein PACTADRAFT_1205 [Pachysolen tannophilus NRRL Y-2460]|uniref:tRNA (uracil(54)-C(5))-methyltransferase n=1 Tax=Pachysolen tannophilus NRRL Y-2460 TaxID=669874 RepID=A0A1E4TXY0_PACTA|nr:hypothetical protein PACTADRAFT_1205 [Pachysolen tannophilus NRRL Y-2460]